MNIYVVNILVGVVIAIISYLFGSVPTGVIIGKVFFKKDIRQFGSKNSGGTNAGRVLGKKVGILVIILDMLKTVIPFYTAWAVLTFSGLKDYMVWGSYNAAPLFYWGSVLFAAIGHCASIFQKFKGGKAVSCFMGTNVLTSWIELVMAGFSFLIVAKKTKYISAASITAGVLGTLTAWVVAIIAVSVPWNPHWLTLMFGFEGAPYLGLEFAVVDTVVSALLIFRHRSNIARLRAGTENKNPFAKSESSN